MSATGTIWDGLISLIGGMLEWLFKELEESVMVLALNIMNLAFRLFPTYRKNIEGFNAVYVFKIQKRDMAVTAIFKNGKMKVQKGEVEDFNVTLVIKDTKSLWTYLTGGGSVFDFILGNGLSWEGNLNYILKFAYLATHLVYVVMDKLKLNRIIPMTR